MNGQILHQLSDVCLNAWKKLNSSEPIRIRHDANRRRQLERNHTAEHLLYSILKKLVHPEILRVSGNKRKDIFTIEVQVPEGVNRDNFDLEKINAELNGAINKGIDVGIFWGNMDRAKEMGIVGRFDEVYEMNRDNLRFVDLGEYGTELCIGTHVRNTGEIEEALIVKFVKEQKNIYKFAAVTGKEEVRSALVGRSSSREHLLYLQHKDEMDRVKKMEVRSSFLMRKKELMGELLALEGRIKVLEKEVDVDLAMAVVKGIRGFFKDGVIMLFFRESGGYRFFAAANGVDLGSLFQAIRNKGGKCGGNSGFGSGVYGGDDFMEIFHNVIG